jgi:hypothetical protein
VLLEEALARDAVGKTGDEHRAVGQMRQHVVRDPGEVAEQVALGERLAARAGGPERLVEVGQGDALPLDLEQELLVAGVELGENGRGDG